jgi:hypothetical protein
MQKHSGPRASLQFNLAQLIYMLGGQRLLAAMHIINV